MGRNRRVIALDSCGFPTQVEELPNRTEASDSLDVLCRTIRSIYINARRVLTSDSTYGNEPLVQYDGGQSRWGRSYKPIWPKVAAHIAALGANPVAYIHCQFADWSRGKKAITPAQLCSDAAVARYMRYRANVRATTAGELEAERTSVHTEIVILVTVSQISYKQAAERALLNLTAVRASPLLRYCLAAEYGLPNIMRYWHNGATIQYVFERETYDELLGIPPELRESGRALLSRLSAQ